MKGKITVTGANFVFLAFALLYLFFQFILIILAAVFGSDFANNNIYGILLVNEYVLILGPVLVYAFKNKLNFKEVFKFNRLKIVPAVLILLISVPAYFVALMLNYFVLFVLQFIGDIPSQPIPVPQNLPQLLVGILIIAVSPAICEEMLHRGILLKAYENRGSMKAVVITSIFFGIFHFDVTNLLGPIFLGLLIGYYVIRTNSIFAGMLAHFLNNTIAELLQYFARNDETAEVVRISMEELGYITLYGAGGVILTMVLIQLFRYSTKNQGILKPSIARVKNDIISVVSHWPVIVVSGIYLAMIGLYMFFIILTKISRAWMG